MRYNYFLENWSLTKTILFLNFVLKLQKFLNLNLIHKLSYFIITTL
jgi:hypothetical protein